MGENGSANLDVHVGPIYTEFILSPPTTSLKYFKMSMGCCIIDLIRKSGFGRFKIQAIILVWLRRIYGKSSQRSQKAIACERAETGAVIKIAVSDGSEV